MPTKPIGVLFCKDLRVQDNPAWAEAVKVSATTGAAIVPFYLWDADAKFAPGAAARVWLHHALVRLQGDLSQMGLTLRFYKGDWAEVMSGLRDVFDSVYLNRTYEPGEDERLGELGSFVNVHDGNALFNPDTTKIYKVFTPFYNYLLGEKWPESIHAKAYKQGSSAISAPEGVELGELELCPNLPWAQRVMNHWDVQRNFILDRMEQKSRQPSDYAHGRDFPAQDFTTKLSPYLAHGVVGPREVLEALPKGHPIARQLIWREFALHSLYRMPWMARGKPYRAEFEKFPWALSMDEVNISPLLKISDINDNLEHKPFDWVSQDGMQTALKYWSRGQTGYGMVDAGMRELWQTGWMHNRARMVVASFLIKHLLIDWRVGEKWFWETLVDADLANNVFGWQWVAGCGLDAAPYFRIFNPTTQIEKFDSQHDYLRRWIPQWGSAEYPRPIVEHSQARQRALEALEKVCK